MPEKIYDILKTVSNILYFFGKTYYAAKLCHLAVLLETYKIKDVEGIEQILKSFFPKNN